MADVADPIVTACLSDCVGKARLATCPKHATTPVYQHRGQQTRHDLAWSWICWELESAFVTFTNRPYCLQNFVREVVRKRVGKYMEGSGADHPLRLTVADAQQVFDKAVREVIGKEQQVSRHSVVTCSHDCTSHAFETLVGRSATGASGKRASCCMCIAAHLLCQCSPGCKGFPHWHICATMRHLAAQAFRQRQEMSCHKDIDRRKVEHSIKEFVRATVHRLRDRR